MEHPQGMRAANLIQSVLKALDEQERLASSERLPRVDRVAEHCGFFCPAACRRLPSTLLIQNYVQGTPNGHHQIGTRNPLHCIAMSKSIFAFLPPKRRDEIMERMTLTRRTSHTITDRANLIEHLQGMRSLGCISRTALMRKELRY